MSSRDHKKYVYLTIALERGGPTHRALLKDAEEIDSKQYPTVAALRLKDFYAGKTRSVEVRQEVVSDESVVVATNGVIAERNAEAAADEW